MTDKISAGVVTDIQYKSERTNAVSFRKILPVHVPADVIRAIDVTYAGTEERQQLEGYVQEYLQYREDAQAALFNFETWVDHTKAREIAPVWRAFKVKGIVKL